MNLDLRPLSPADEARAWAGFVHSPMKDVLHNAVAKKILSLRDQLENCALEDFQATKNEIKAYRFLLGLIHRHDELATK